MTSELKRLTSGARAELTESFLKGEDERLPDDVIDDYVRDTDLEADLDILRTKLDSIRNTYKKHAGKMDREAAPAVHRAIDISRHEAADSRIWNHLAVCEFPEFVRYRWSYEGKNAMRKKFWTYGTALDSVSSTFERLWWIAELTQEEGDYTYTRRAFGNRRLCFRVFDIQLGRYKPAARACIEVLHDEETGTYEGNDVIDGTIQQLRKAATNVTLEGRTEAELVEIVRDIKSDVKDDLS